MCSPDHWRQTSQDYLNRKSVADRELLSTLMTGLWPKNRNSEARENHHAILHNSHGVAYRIDAIYLMMPLYVELIVKFIFSRRSLSTLSKAFSMSTKAGYTLPPLVWSVPSGREESLQLPAWCGLKLWHCLYAKCASLCSDQVCFIVDMEPVRKIILDYRFCHWAVSHNYIGSSSLGVYIIW